MSGGGTGNAGDTGADRGDAATGSAEIPPALPEAGLAPFEALDLRVAVVRAAEPNPGARSPAYRLWLDLGPLGSRQSSARITERYRPEQLVGRRVVVAANLGSRRIAGFRSEVLVLGAADEHGRIALLAAPEDIPPGARVH